MDATLHTIIATGLMFISYRIGLYMGHRGGISDMIQTLLTIFEADSMEINEDGEFHITKKGKTTKVN